MLVFAYDKTFLGPLTTSGGDLAAPTAMAIRPGFYAPLSRVLPPRSAFVGAIVSCPLVLLNHLNETVSDDHSTSVSLLALNASATGFVWGTSFAIDIVGTISHDPTAPAHSSLSALFEIPYIGDWTIAVWQVRRLPPFAPPPDLTPPPPPNPPPTPGKRQGVLPGLPPRGLRGRRRDGA